MELITKEFKDLKIVFTNNGEINATQTAKLFGKNVREFIRSKSYKDYSIALANHLQIGVGNLHTAKSGGNLKKDEQGTFLHPRLLVFFARWLSPEFAVWCDELVLNKLKEQIDFNKSIIDQQQTTIDELVEVRDKDRWWMND